MARKALGLILVLIFAHVSIFAGQGKLVAEFSEGEGYQVLPEFYGEKKHENVRAERDLLFDQAATGLFAFCSSQWDSVYPFYSKIADNFSLVGDATIDSIVWWGGYWSMQQNGLVDFWVEFYAESIGYGQPKQDPEYSERIAFSEFDLGGYYRYEASIPPFPSAANTTYWLTCMGTIVFPPHWGNNCSWPGNSPGWGDGQECFFKSDMYGYPMWTVASTALGETYESSFQLFGTLVGVDEGDIVSNFPLGLFTKGSNPCSNGRIAIAYHIPFDGHVALKIHDAAGKAVTSLTDGIMKAGQKQVYWSGRNSKGMKVASGIYYVRLEFAGVSRTEKIVVVR